ncbi:hypothetical protein EH243_10350 [Amphritea opalescens]|uniref:Uncharacterized protein n=1 Tax=Amphritea opalescens TaxID=2490544 RepID=A0A430KQ81_9GAMM|nr:hypothetical protein [Amphritea opalescens]RTE65667.1 hypothetical protein EH243_10350 [Amphritea opalescens]
MIKYNFDAESSNSDLQAIVAEANEERAAYLKEILSNSVQKVINLFSTELPAFFTGPLAHR